MRPNDTEMQTSEALFTKIYAVRVFEARRIGRAFSSFPDVQLHIGDAPLGAGPESILPTVVMDSGLAHCAPRNDGLRINSPGLRLRGRCAGGAICCDFSI